MGNIIEKGKRMKYLITLTVLFSTLFAQAVPEMVTDRPDQTESSVTIPRGWLQIETGALMEHDSPTEDNNITNLVYNTSLLRYGLFDNTEIRFGAEYMQQKVEVGSTEITESGLAPVVVGFKTRFTEEKGLMPELAFLGHLTLPKIGADEFQTDYLIPDFRIAGTKTLNDQFSAAFNIGGEWNGVAPNTNIFYSFVIGAGIHNKIAGFIEVYGYVIEEFSPDHRFDTGLTYLINDDFQLDISGGVGINDKAPDYFISGGLSYRLRLKK